MKLIYTFFIALSSFFGSYAQEGNGISFSLTREQHLGGLSYAFKAAPGFHLSFNKDYDDGTYFVYSLGFMNFNVGR